MFTQSELTETYQSNNLTEVVSRLIEDSKKTQELYEHNVGNGKVRDITGEVITL